MIVFNSFFFFNKNETKKHTCLVSLRALWKSLRNEARLNLYMLLILARSLMTKYSRLPFSASGRYVLRSWSSEDWSRTDSVSESFIVILLALVLFRESSSSLFSSMFPLALASSWKIKRCIYLKRRSCDLEREKHNDFLININHLKPQNIHKQHSIYWKSIILIIKYNFFPLL